LSLVIVNGDGECIIVTTSLGEPVAQADRLVSKIAGCQAVVLRSLNELIVTAM